MSFGREVWQGGKIFTPTPSDTDNESAHFIFRVKAAGDVKVTGVNMKDTDGEVISGLEAGDVVDWIVCKRIWSTNTTVTAANIECYSE